MAKFLVMVEGHGFRSDFGDGTVPIGFFANRVVDAHDVDSIEEESLFQKISKELIETKVARTPKARMKISKISEFASPPTTNYSGFSFFEEHPLISRFLRMIGVRVGKVP